MERRPLTRDKALAWNEYWSYTDLEVIAHHLSRLDVTGFYVTPSGSYVGCLDGNGAIPMYIHAGYLTFKKGLLPEGSEFDWGIPLSTFSPHASPTTATPEDGEICPVHFIALPVSGICDECS